MLAADKLKKQRAVLQLQIDHAQADMVTYEQQLATERKKLNKMEKFSFVNTFRTWTGKQHELMEKCYDEIATTELKLVEVQLMAEDLNDDLVDVVYKINAINEPYAATQIQVLEHQMEQIDQSKSYLHEAQLALQRFKNELLDIQEMKAGSLQIETDGFVKFADYFLDDIFSAWSIHSKIATSMTQMSHVLDDVRNTLRALQQKQFIAQEKKQYLLDERAGILANGEQTL